MAAHPSVCARARTDMCESDHDCLIMSGYAREWVWVRRRPPTGSAFFNPGGGYKKNTCSEQHPSCNAVAIGHYKKHVFRVTSIMQCCSHRSTCWIKKCGLERSRKMSNDVPVRPRGPGTMLQRPARGFSGRSGRRPESVFGGSIGWNRDSPVPPSSPLIL